jgi:hypothetical protein
MVVEFAIWVVEAELVIAIAGWARRVETSWDAAEWGPDGVVIVGTCLINAEASRAATLRG